MQTRSGPCSIPITPESIRSSFRRIDPAQYPELAGYSWDRVYGHGDKMAPGALYLAAEMTRSMSLTPGDTVIDLGCGKGVTSEFFAQHFDVHVSAADLWVSVDCLRRKFEAKGLDNQITPYNLDATDDLPFPVEYFDAIFCMQSRHPLPAH